MEGRESHWAYSSELPGLGGLTGQRLAGDRIARVESAKWQRLRYRYKEVAKMIEKSMDNHSRSIVELIGISKGV